MTSEIQDFPRETEQAMEQAAALERQSSDQCLTAQRELAELEQRSAHADTDRSVREFGKKLAEAREAIGVWLRKIDTIRAERRTAIIEHRRAQAVRPREQAAELRHQAAALDAEALPHLEALRQIQGVGFAPAHRPQPSRGVGSMAAAEQAGIRPIPTRPAPTKAELLVGDADALERTAAAMERDAERVVAGGVVEGKSLEQLVDAVFEDPARIGPRIPDVAEWLAAATAGEQRRLEDWHRRHPYSADETKAERDRFIQTRTAEIDRRYRAEEARAEHAPNPTKAEQIIQAAEVQRAKQTERMAEMAEQLAPDAPPSATAALTLRLVWRDGVIDERESRATAEGPRDITAAAETVDAIGAGRRTSALTEASR
jgi:hypothetical protein